MQFNYLTIEKSVGYSFFIIPKTLITDPKFKRISTDAKLLYSMFLDRASLSIKNEWIDADKHVYIIYRNQEIMEDMGCSKNSVTKLLDELKTAGLIEKKKQGLNRPDLIYVKDFTSEVTSEDSANAVESMVSPESQNLGLRNPKIWDSGIPKNGIQESQNMGLNSDTDINNTNKSETDVSDTDFIDNFANKNIKEKEKSENDKETKDEESYQSVDRPTEEELHKFCATNNLIICEPKFLEYYDLRHWKLKGEPIRNWRGLAIQWNKHQFVRCLDLENPDIGKLIPEFIWQIAGDDMSKNDKNYVTVTTKKLVEDYLEENYSWYKKSVI